MATDEKKTGFRALIASLRNPKTGMMLVFGFSAGLPYALLLGTLYAWLSDAKVDLETMGVFSLIGLTYAFKFLWSPILDRFTLPLFGKLGFRKGWIIPAQLMLGLFLVILSFLDPNSQLGWFSLLAGLGAFASATQDVVIDAWRVDVADDVATLDMLSSVYQLGYRLAALAGGALALFLADFYDWPMVYFIMGVTMLLIAGISIFAPQAENPQVARKAESLYLQEAGQIAFKYRAIALLIVGSLWAWALTTVVIFMVDSLTAAPELRPDSVEFITLQGPLIVMTTVVIPAIIAAILEYCRHHGKFIQHEPTEAGTDMLNEIVDHGYRALILPLTDIIGRLGWAAILVLGLILSYRFTDLIWGSFAYPFYLGELEYTKSEVALASKFFGVGMTMLGLALGGILAAFIGRMATLTLGAFSAAASNLLYMDLANGGFYMGLLSKYTGFTYILSQFGQDDRMAKLMFAISGENVAGGLAGAAFVTYLSAITSKKYSAVQYALLSSLTFLVGTLGRSAMGKYIEDNGYAAMFILAAGLGLIAVILCFMEWARTGNKGPQAQ